MCRKKEAAPNISQQLYPFGDFGPAKSSPLETNACVAREIQSRHVVLRTALWVRFDVEELDRCEGRKLSSERKNMFFFIYYNGLVKITSNRNISRIC